MAKDLERYVSLQYFQNIKADVEPYDHELYIHNLTFQEHLIELTCEGCKVSLEILKKNNLGAFRKSELLFQKFFFV